ncbi:hypothetical protein RJT34_03640 [Clitoria ternatea]|uniref:Uncharacterized protein n=1 Tax=Clitoria ternatea TaxID=43366 RepID=A0AAN9KL47_CLITE
MNSIGNCPKLLAFLFIRALCLEPLFHRLRFYTITRHYSDRISCALENDAALHHEHRTFSGTVEAAKQAIDAGVDAIIVQGREAGGHVFGQGVVCRFVETEESYAHPE